ncbi:hypothetical protein LIER_32807 [Lithospermum erythrorhizon]|uniref:Uncharacterized protein n=1 Tax=Lithospermum erythrorhizon TaxID=34254 RepID=A0AAV3RX51_LITER
MVKDEGGIKWLEEVSDGMEGGGGGLLGHAFESTSVESKYIDMSYQAKPNKCWEQKCNGIKINCYCCTYPKNPTKRCRIRERDCKDVCANFFEPPSSGFKEKDALCITRDGRVGGVVEFVIEML